MDIVKVILKVEEILKHKHEFEGEEFITFEVAKMKQTDNFGRTHCLLNYQRGKLSFKNRLPPKRRESIFFHFKHDYNLLFLNKLNHKLLVSTMNY